MVSPVARAAMPPITGVGVLLVCAVTVGREGGVASIVSAKAVLAPLVLPATSVAVALKLWLPSASAVPAVKLKVPEGPSVAVPSKVAPS